MTKIGKLLAILILFGGIIAISYYNHFIHQQSSNTQNLVVENENLNQKDKESIADKNLILSSDGEINKAKNKTNKDDSKNTSPQITYSTPFNNLNYNSFQFDTITDPLITSSKSIVGMDLSGAFNLIFRDYMKNELQNPLFKDSNIVKDLDTTKRK